MHATLKRQVNPGWFTVVNSTVGPVFLAFSGHALSTCVISSHCAEPQSTKGARRDESHVQTRLEQASQVFLPRLSLSFLIYARLYFSQYKNILPCHPSTQQNSSRSLRSQEPPLTRAPASPRKVISHSQQEIWILSNSKAKHRPHRNTMSLVDRASWRWSVLFHLPPSSLRCLQIYIFLHWVQYRRLVVPSGEIRARCLL